jgi:hypothetical protein
VKFTLEHAMKAQREIALFFLQPPKLDGGGGVNAKLRLLYPKERDTIPTAEEAGLAPVPIWTGTENLTPTEIRSPDRPTCSKSL